MRTRYARWLQSAPLKAAATLIIGVAAIFLATPSAQASNGGCSTYDNKWNNGQRSLSVGICINDRNTGYAVYPDYYVKDAAPSNCRIVVEVWDNYQKRFGDQWQDSNSCKQGHHPDPSSGTWCVSDFSAGYNPQDKGIQLHAYYRLYINGKQVNDTSTNSLSSWVDYYGNGSC